MQGLTTREAQVAKLVADGYSNQEIGNRLQISEQTVKNHLQSVFRKLALANRVELALRMARKRHKLRSSAKSRTRIARS